MVTTLAHPLLSLGIKVHYTNIYTPKNENRAREKVVTGMDPIRSHPLKRMAQEDFRSCSKKNKKTVVPDNAMESSLVLKDKLAVAELQPHRTA